MSEKTKPKILLAGFGDQPSNQFTKALQRYGLEFVRHGGEAHKKIPVDCDALILLKKGCSTHGFLELKNAYKDKRVFSATFGFSEIREAFEDFLFNFNAKTIVAPPAPKRMYVAPPQAPVEKMEEPVQPQERRYDPAEATRIAGECFEADMSVADTADMLNAHGLMQQNKVPYNANNVYNLKIAWRKRKSLEPKVEAPVPKPVVAIEQPKKEEPKKQPAKKATTQTHELITAVLASALTQDQKLDAIAKITTGEITELETSKVKILRGSDNGQILQVSSGSILSPSTTVIVNLTRAQALLVVKFFKPINEFSKGATNV